MHKLRVGGARKRESEGEKAAGPRWREQKEPRRRGGCSEWEPLRGSHSWGVGVEGVKSGR